MLNTLVKGVQGALVDIQNLLPGADNITVRLRLQAPAADFPRLQPVFCRATRTVSRPILSTTCSSTNRSTSSCSVHPELPTGAGEQASWINSASPEVSVSVRPGPWAPPLTRVFPKWESVAAAGSVCLPRVGLGQARRERLSPVV